ncbi:hypothetical protein [Dactylosporangium salmoneum]|uniref:Uncharacterized protein n=1 Tax=Dactylosporangium salmoneum TaxID=53361 RepID=A0ABP5T6C4_9ACTN
MDRARIPALVCAAVLSAITGIAELERWHSEELLATAALGAWIIWAAAAATERILADIANLRAEVAVLRTDIETYGDQRHGDGVIDGYHRAAPAKPHLSRVY